MFTIQGVKEHRVKILAVVTSTNIMGASGKDTGYELTELARGYYIFQANGFDVDTSQYQAVYFVGGKGTMFDFPENASIKSLVSDYYQWGKVVGAVCHGPAALVNVTLDDGTDLLANKAVARFTNDEELLLIPDAKEVTCRNAVRF